MLTREQALTLRDEADEAMTNLCPCEDPQTLSWDDQEKWFGLKGFYDDMTNELEELDRLDEEAEDEKEDEILKAYNEQVDDQLKKETIKAALSLVGTVIVTGVVYVGLYFVARSSINKIIDARVEETIADAVTRELYNAGCI